MQETPATSSTSRLPPPLGCCGCQPPAFPNIFPP